MSIAGAALVVSLVALVLSGWAALSGHRQARAAEEQVEMMRAELEAVAARPPWQIQHYTGYKYLLTNVGGTTCYDIAVTGDDFHRLESVHDTTMRPAESGTFFAISSSVSKGSRVTVQWSAQPGGEKRHWTCALPPK